MLDVIVNKPWGKEFCLLSTSDLAIWHLHINSNASTSFHSHLSKKTSLIVLSGIAEVSFFNGKHRLISGDKINIRNGVFHSTKSLRGDLTLIEVECPNNKLDLVRLEDDFGRAGKGYETEEHFTPNTFVPNFTRGEKLGDCILTQFAITKAEELIDRPESKVVVLSGKITYQEHTILDVGDTVDNITLTRLAKKFTVHPMSILEVKNVYNH